MSVDLEKCLEERNLPEILTNEKGERISTVAKWEKERRPEILEFFKDNVYGRPPIKKPYDLEFNIDKEETIFEGKAKIKKVSITYYNSGRGNKGELPFFILLPNKIDKPVPGFVYFCDYDNVKNIKNKYKSQKKSKENNYELYEIIKRGYTVILLNTSFAKADDENFNSTLFKVYEKNQKKRPSNSWGILSAWAWGASRVMDYLETDESVNNDCLGIIGHSRAGKAALWCGAQDQRFSLTISNNSGCTGAALARGKTGERIKDINKVWSQWTCKNYNNYNKKEKELAVDQHMLLALIAPRNLYVASASEDSWADPKSEFLSCVAAEPVFNLYGYEGLGIKEKPEVGQHIHKGKIGYHLREGGHDLTLYDWNLYMDYADLIFKKNK